MNVAVAQWKFTLLHRVPSGKFNRVNALIWGGLSAMRVNPFAGETIGRGGLPVTKCPGIFWKELARYFGISRPSVSQAIKRGEKIAKEDNVKLLS
jgi:hypothetical protein